jgi:hypothetical protein
LHSIRVLQDDGYGPTSGIVAGIDYVIANAVKPAVINMSLGGIYSNSIDAAVNAAINSGITVVVAAGNSNDNACYYSPARVKNAITVGATDSNDTRADYSNFGSCVDLFAPGSDIPSDWNTSDTATNTISGTSMASPHVAGAAALYLASHPTAKPAEVAKALLAASVNNKVIDPAGSPNKLLNISGTVKSAPVLSAPTSGTLSASSTFALAWSSVENVDHYELQIATDSKFLSLVADQNPIYSTNVNFTAVSDAKYYWRVRGISATNLNGAWSKVYVFTRDTIAPNTPVLSNPLNSLIVNGSPAFSWLASPTAIKYQFQFETSVDGNSDTYEYRSGDLPKTSFKLPAIPPLNTPIFWQVRAADTTGNWSDWSAQYSVTVQPLKPASPKISLPKNNTATNDTTPILSWGSVLYADKYDVQISNNAKFVGANTYSDISGTSIETDVMADGKYYWRVQAKNLFNQVSAWSGSSSFTVDTVPPAAPVLSKPLNNGTVIGNPSFSWLAALGATKYQVQYAYTLDSDNDTYDYRSGVIGGLKHNPTTIPTALSTIYWQVRAMDAAGNWSDWSNSFALTIQPPVPAAPRFTGPAINSMQITASPTLAWGSVLFADKYHVQIANNSKFLGPLIYDYLDVADNFKVSGPLADGKYYWRVQSKNVNGVYGAWSSTYSFMVDTTPPLTPTLVSPVGSQNGVRTLTTFKWEGSHLAKYYQFQYDTSSDFSSPDYDVANLTTPYLKLPAPLSPNLYFWRVRAGDPYGNWSNWSRTNAVAVLPPVVKDGGFEETNGSWSEYSTHGWSIISDSGLPLATHSGYYLAWLGGGNYETSTITQPNVTMNYVRYLHFWYVTGSSDYCGYDYAYVYLNNTEVDRIPLCKPYSKNAWVHHVVDLRFDTGRTVSLTFKVVTDGSLSSSFFVDDVVFTDSTDIPANISPANMYSPTTGMSSQSVQNILQLKPQQ